MTPDGLERRETSAQEIAALFGRYAVALADAGVAEQSADGRYIDAYTAGFLLAKIVVRASGYRVRGGENHRDTLSAVPWLMGSTAQRSVDVLDAARKQRNVDLYDGAGTVEDSDVRDLVSRVRTFESEVRAWLDARHPELRGE
ncbi:MAG: hypothetical protein Q7W30_02490 [Coriobacteriia bacterium]|nr:hypothetical protein [Coriobacteriia bacterium]